MASAAAPPRILLIDSYDSFTNNLAALLTRCTAATVHTIHNDAPFATVQALAPFLPSFDAVVVGPGPGSPELSSDVGIVRDLWHLAEDRLLPVFGVCLGLQSLCLEFGACIHRLGTVKHGLTSVIEHCGDDIFAGVSGITAVRYHSLHAELPGGTQLQPLAWADDEENGRVLMGVRHTQKPFWAVQYHPESICTEGGGDGVIENFWRLAQEWNRQHSRRTVPLSPSWTMPPRELSLLEQQERWRTAQGLPAKETTEPTVVQTRCIRSCDLTAPQICEMFGVNEQQDFVLLDSAATPGRWSIIGIISPGTTRLIKYTAGDDHAVVSIAGDTRSQNTQTVPLDAYQGSVWRYLASFMEANRGIDGAEDSPFWGGLVGYFSYELGVSSLLIPLRADRKRRADVNLAFAERSIVLDTHTGRIYVQSLLAHDDANWLDATVRRLRQQANLPPTPSATPPPPRPESTKVTKPASDHYMDLVRAAQAHLAAGDSYELCLTARTHVALPAPASSPWTLYTRLRARNAAPYAAFLRLQGVTLLSSSPERFLSYSRTGHVQLRPIKGTVRKSPTTTFESASAILNTPKERAENLMIVDLIRHDLARILPTVAVSKLMAVEEYATVYQLVSVIEGALPQSSNHHGIDVLAASLPPGSMTGAPKKRSVELLQQLENGMPERGVYSGVAGYWSVCGAGDWCVIIRSAVRYDEDGRDNEWTVGAGGAVTALSSPKDEWDEMSVKADSTVNAFL